MTARNPFGTTQMLYDNHALSRGPPESGSLVWLRSQDQYLCGDDIRVPCHSVCPVTDKGGMHAAAKQLCAAALQESG